PQFLKVHNFPFPSLLTTLFPHLSALVYVLCSVVESNSSSKQPLQDSRALRRKSSGVIAEASHWNYQEVVAQMLKYYAELGDVQMSVTVLLVLGTGPVN
ncbi:hypothetical protein GBAR_LOCUS22907, partial [Geodia barretti]